MTTQVRYRLLLFSLFVLAAASCTKAMAENTPGAEWPRWRGPNGNGVTTDANWDWHKLSGGPKILWKVNVGMGVSNVAIQGGRLYTMGVQGRFTNAQIMVLCLDASTGAEIWKSAIGGTVKGLTYGIMSTPAFEGGSVYVLRPDGILCCLDASNGEVRWTRNLIKELGCNEILNFYATSPVVDGDLVLINTNSAGMALNKVTGEKIWTSAPVEKPLNDGGYHATPVLVVHDGTRCALLFSDAGLYLVEAATGKHVWFYEWPPDSEVNAADPVVFDGKVFLSVGDQWDQGALLDMSGAEPRLLWQNGNMGTLYSTSVYHEGFLYGSLDSPGADRFRCVDAKDGSVAWKTDMVQVSQIVADGKLIVLEVNGILHIVDSTPSAYTEIAIGDLYGGDRKVSRIFMTPPALSDGRLYCRNLLGDLICVDVRK